MQASLSARAQILGMQEWGNGGPAGSEGSQQNIEETTFFCTNGGTLWSFFPWVVFRNASPPWREIMHDSWCSSLVLVWPSQERLLAYIGTIILVHTHLNLQLATIIYYLRDGCLPIAQMFGRYCCSCFDLRDAERTDSKSSPEGTHRQLVSAAKMCNLS
jgi:beta-amylase